jgi:hypothetical protein
MLTAFWVDDPRATGARQNFSPVFARNTELLRPESVHILRNKKVERENTHVLVVVFALSAFLRSQSRHVVCVTRDRRHRLPLVATDTIFEDRMTWN